MKKLILSVILLVGLVVSAAAYSGTLFIGDKTYRFTKYGVEGIVGMTGQLTFYLTDGRKLVIPNNNPVRFYFILDN